MTGVKWTTILLHVIAILQIVSVQAVHEDDQVNPSIIAISFLGFATAIWVLHCCLKMKKETEEDKRESVRNAEDEIRWSRGRGNVV